MVAWRFLWVSKSLRHPTRLLVVIAPKHCFRGEETLEADLHFESKRPDPFDPDVVASVDIQGPDGSIETITGTPIHPIWSVARQDWVPLAELAEGEHLLSLLPSPLRGRKTEGEGAVTAIVLSVSLSRVTQPVYNIEVHSEHVYQFGELCVVVHNACVPKVTDAKLGNLVKDLF